MNLAEYLMGTAATAARQHTVLPSNKRYRANMLRMFEQYVRAKGPCKLAEVQATLKASERAAQSYMAELIEADVIERVQRGSGYVLRVVKK